MTAGHTLPSASADMASNEPNLHMLDPVTSNTEANIMPETERQPEADIDEALEEKTPVPTAIDPKSFPDGGLEAWSVVLGAFCCLFCSFGWINCIGVFQDYYENNQLANYSPSTVAWVPSLETFMMFFGGPFVGKILDNYGPRYVLLVGTFFHVFGLMMASLSKEYYQFVLSQGICSPFGASCVFYAAMSSVGTWFFRRRAFAFGVMASGSSLGGVIFPIMIERLVRQVGFGWAMRSGAFLILGLLVIANVTVKSRLPPHKKPVVVMEFITPLRELPYLLTVISSFLFFFGMFLPFTYLILQGTKSGMSVDLANYLIPILNAASVFGRILPGFLGDRIGRYNVMIIMCYFAGIITLALWLPSSSNAPIIVYAALYGFASGAFVSLIPALVAQISDVRQIGVRNGTNFGIISLAALTGSPIGGAIVSHQHGGYTGLQIFCGVMMLGGATTFVMARVVLAGWNPRTRV